MMRFVDLRSAEIAGVRFAFWDTVVDRFVEGDGVQAWGTWAEFLDDMPAKTRGARGVIASCQRLVPSWAVEELSEAEAQGVPA